VLQQKRSSNGKSRSRKPFFWFGGSEPDVSYVYGDEGYSRRGAGEPIYDDDPEPLPELGMGNIAYEPPLMVPVYDSKIGNLLALSGDAEFIRMSLSDRNSPVKAAVGHRKAILELYQARNFQPVWITDGRPSDRVSQVLQVLSSAGEDGMDPLAYLPLGLVSYASASETFDNLTESQRAQADIALTAMTLDYAQHIAYGQFEPGKLSLYNDIKIAMAPPESMLRIIAYSPFPAQYLKSLAPTNPAYGILKKELAALNNATDQQEQPPLPSGRKLVKPGQSDPRMPELRARMEEFGFLDPGDALVAEDKIEVLDKALSKAIKAYQAANGLQQTGTLSLALVDKLNADPTDAKRTALISSLERIRWLPRDMGSRHVFVNQAAFSADIVENGKPVWSTKVIVGKPMTQTAAFHDEFETVVFNPSWGIPQSILVNEYLPKLKRDPSYLDRIGYKITNDYGEPVSSRNVDWWAYNNRVPYNVQQPPGNDNALGELKFLFPNAHSIYMHDTPTRKLFADPVRAYSHGCVRVEDPRQFASILLGWDSGRIATELQSGSKTVPISIKTKVHLTYFTAWPDANGVVKYHRDLYERDKTLMQAFTMTAEALGAAQRKRFAESGAVSGGIVQ
jgi:murein L,D-transpeptidase YcbB/YkuD